MYENEFTHLDPQSHRLITAFETKSCCFVRRIIELEGSEFSNNSFSLSRLRLAYRLDSISCQIKETRLRILLDHFITHHPIDKVVSAGGRRTTTCFDYRCIECQYYGAASFRSWWPCRAAKVIPSSDVAELTLPPALYIRITSTKP
jgi:hypothetical protein